jgi:hypothetical protein
MYTVSDTGLTVRSYTQAGLTPGEYYVFVIEARNVVGYSQFSMPVTFVAAQEPEIPDAPTTTIDEVANIITINWEEPADNGTPVIGYRVLIRQNDLSTYSENKADCDAQETAIAEARTCSMTVQKLMLAPYRLTQGVSVFARIIAINEMGESQESAGGNGAVLKLSVVPDAPRNLARDDVNTWEG